MQDVIARRQGEGGPGERRFDQQRMRTIARRRARQKCANAGPPRAERRSRRASRRPQRRRTVRGSGPRPNPAKATSRASQSENHCVTYHAEPPCREPRPRQAAPGALLALQWGGCKAVYSRSKCGQEGAKPTRRSLRPAQFQRTTFMNPSIELLARRRSLQTARTHGPRARGRSVETILRLASRVPDHGKLAPWRFILIEGEARERAGRLALEIRVADKPDLDEPSREAELTRFTRAPLVVAVVSRAAPHAKIPEWEQVLSAGAACMNSIIAAKALGFGSSWLTEWCAYDSRFRAALGLGEIERIAGFVHIGRPKVAPEERAAARARRHRQPFCLDLRRQGMYYETGARDRSLLPHDPFKAIVLRARSAGFPPAQTTGGSISPPTASSTRFRPSRRSSDSPAKASRIRPRSRRRAANSSPISPAST